MVQGNCSVPMLAPEYYNILYHVTHGFETASYLVFLCEKSFGFDKNDARKMTADFSFWLD